MKELFKRVVSAALYVVIGFATAMYGAGIPPVEYEEGFEVIEPCDEHGEHVVVITDSRLIREYEIIHEGESAWVNWEYIELLIFLSEFPYDEFEQE